MDEVFEIARSLGLGGLGLLATVYSVKLAIQAVDLARAQQRRRSGPNRSKVDLDELRVVCPLAPGKHSLDDAHEVLIQIRAGMERMNETQNEIESDMKKRSHRLYDVLSALRLELARREE
jgi:hypothetical protein